MPLSYEMKVSTGFYEPLEYLSRVVLVRSMTGPRKPTASIIQPKLINNTIKSFHSDAACIDFDVSSRLWVASCLFANLKTLRKAVRQQQQRLLREKKCPDPRSMDGALSISTQNTARHLCLTLYFPTIFPIAGPRWSRWSPGMGRRASRDRPMMLLLVDQDRDRDRKWKKKASTRRSPPPLPPTGPQSPARQPWWRCRIGPHGRCCGS